MPEAKAVLSYTRKDDQFFGGYITAFRKSLELGVHVVTGEEEFRLFQDIDGIVIGEQWQKKIADVIDASSFLIPMLSPLFFNSGPCRDEVGLFLKHEHALQRNDLILPVYFIESPKLEKQEETAKDPMAQEILTRQMFDWREKAKLPLEAPVARDAVLDLARAIATAIDRLKPATPGAPIGTVHALPDVHREDLAMASRAAAISADARREELSERVILWVDDRPDNNAWERRALASYGMRFVLAKTTEEAEQLLRDHTFDAIISDMVRPGDSRAGFTLLDWMRTAGNQTPYLIYCGTSTAYSQANEGRRHSAQLVTAIPTR
jgi:CheY-like chemotaxis protein